MASTSRQGLTALTRRFAGVSSQQWARSFATARPAYSNSDSTSGPGPSTSGNSKANRPLANEEAGEPVTPQPPRSNRQASQPELVGEDASGTASSVSQRSPSTTTTVSAAAAAPGRPIKIDDFSLSTFPQFLRKAHPLLDSSDHIEVEPDRSAPFGGTIELFGTEPDFQPRPPSASSLVESTGGEEDGSMAGAEVLSQLTPLQQSEINSLHRHILSIRRVVRMTGKGKIASIAVAVVVGNGKGLVGFGQGKDEVHSNAAVKAFKQAVQNMDYVNRFESRTIQRSVTGEWGATKVHLRPRPPGFGLRCPQTVHSVARSAGISDLSASISGSTNPLNVCRAVCAALWGGAHPVGLGDGLGGSARRKDLGQGVKSIEQIEVERGRRFRVISK